MKEQYEIEREQRFLQQQNERLAALKSKPVRVVPEVEIDPDTGIPYGLADLIDMGTYD